MAIESNIFEWLGDSIDMTLNTFVQVTSSNVNDGIVTSNYAGTDTTYAIVSRKNLITAAAYPRITLPTTNVLHNMATPAMGTDTCRTTPPFG